jgi:hypothetical protein
VFLCFKTGLAVPWFAEEQLGSLQETPIWRVVLATMAMILQAL